MQLISNKEIRYIDNNEEHTEERIQDFDLMGYLTYESPIEDNDIHRPIGYVWTKCYIDKPLLKIDLRELDHEQLLYAISFINDTVSKLNLDYDTVLSYRNEEEISFGDWLTVLLDELQYRKHNNLDL